MSDSESRLSTFGAITQRFVSTGMCRRVSNIQGHLGAMVPCPYVRREGGCVIYFRVLTGTLLHSRCEWRRAAEALAPVCGLAARCALLQAPAAGTASTTSYGLRQCVLPAPVSVPYPDNNTITTTMTRNVIALVIVTTRTVNLLVLATSQ